MDFPRLPRRDVPTSRLRGLAVAVALLCAACSSLSDPAGSTGTLDNGHATTSASSFAGSGAGEFVVTVQPGLEPDVRLTLGTVTVAQTNSGAMVVADDGSGAAFTCSGSVVFVVDPDGTNSVDEFAAGVDEQATRMECIPEVVVPISCLGMTGDPAACSED